MLRRSRSEVGRPLQDILLVALAAATVVAVIASGAADAFLHGGSQATAARDLIEGCGGVFAGIAVMVDQLDDHVRVGLPVITRILIARDLPES